MLEGFISSKTKASILIRLFLNPETQAYLRELASEFGVSTNSVRTELNHLTDHGILLAQREGRNVFYRANTEHPLFPEVSSMVRKITGIDRLAESVIERLGDLDAAYVTGAYARGEDTGILDVVLVGEVDRSQLDRVVRKTERYIQRKVRTLVLSQEEFDALAGRGTLQPYMKLWQQRGPAPAAAEPKSERRSRPR